MALTFEIDLHKMSRSANFALVLLLPVAFVLGLKVSFYFHFATVTLLLLLSLIHI